MWDVGQVYRDPCHWHGPGFDPGPGVSNLVAALVAQKMRNASTPTDATFAGYAGKFLEWSVPADMKSSTWTDFDTCDLASNGVDRDFANWLSNDGQAESYEEVPGQVDELWVLDVNGQRLVVDATYSPNTSLVTGRSWSRVVELSAPFRDCLSGATPAMLTRPRAVPRHTQPSAGSDAGAFLGVVFATDEVVEISRAAVPPMFDVVPVGPTNVGPD